MSRRALVATRSVPQGDRDGGSYRVLRHILSLRAGGWSVVCLAVDGIDDMRSARALEGMDVMVHEPSAHWLDDITGDASLDLALFAYWQVAELYAPVIRTLSPSTRIVVDSVDVQLLRDARRSFVMLEEHGVHSLLDDDYGLQVVGELNTYAAADAVLAVSNKEAALINDLIGQPDLAHAIADGEHLLASEVPFAERSGILFVGSFRHLPNVGAAEHLCRDIVPLIDPLLLERHPVYIVGEGLEATSLGAEVHHSQVRMVGWVPSLIPYLSRARVSVAPLRFGAGTKGKVVQALMAGSPMVSTSVGIEGLPVRDGEHLLVADDPGSFAACLNRLLADDVLCEQLARSGRELIARTHSRETVQACLLDTLERVLSRPAKPPLATKPDSERYERRSRYLENQKVIGPIRTSLARVLPADATVLVVSDGSAELLKLRPQQAWHFPQGKDGEHAPYYPHDSDALIAQLEDLRDRGADHLLLPARQQWWLRYYPELGDYLKRHHQAVVENDHCLLFRLLAPADAGDESVAGVAARDGNGLGGDAPRRPGIRLVAFYLPQFHPVPENDAWWGEGFTEWANVAKAKPLFPGHRQPHVPADLGFYDLRLPEARQAQAEMARQHGISAFCYYHYWFMGKRLLERPFNEVLATGEPDFPFCLCWANEPWSRRWDGTSRDVLQSQLYSDEDDVQHIYWLLPALADPRALTIEGKPVFLVYNARGLPDPARTTDVWRREVRRAGLPGIYLIAVERASDVGRDFTRLGFDAKVLFQPHFGLLNTVPLLDVGQPKGLRTYDYDQAWPILSNPEPVPYRRYETVCPGWDNSARAGDAAVVLHNSTPEGYERWLTLAVERASRAPSDHRVVFLNAWNEWAEGCHLEPDLLHGRRYLEATKAALKRAAAVSTEGPAGLASTCAASGRQ